MAKPNYIVSQSLRDYFDNSIKMAWIMAQCMFLAILIVIGLTLLILT